MSARITHTIPLTDNFGLRQSLARQTDHIAGLIDLVHLEVRESVGEHQIAITFKQAIKSNSYRALITPVKPGVLPTNCVMPTSASDRPTMRGMVISSRLRNGEAGQINTMPMCAIRFRMMLTPDARCWSASDRAWGSGGREPCHCRRSPRRVGHRDRLCPCACAGACARSGRSTSSCPWCVRCVRVSAQRKNNKYDV